jgi:hypothetical protein
VLNKPELKQYLMSGQFLNALSRRKYFSFDELYVKLSKKYPDLKRVQLSRYMFDVVKNGKIYGAGRGWYSLIDSPLTAEPEFVQEIVDLLANEYPQVVFSCWSTKHIRSFIHHLLAKFVTFVYTQWEAMEMMGDFLESEGYKVWVNPHGKDINRFHVNMEKTVVIRPLISRVPVNGHFATFEKILVDLGVEIRQLPLMDENEYDTLLPNALAAGRVDVGTLISYAKRRRLSIDKTVFNIRKAL